MIGDDDFFMQNADYHYGASDAEKMYGRGYDDYNYNSRASGLLLRPPTLEEQKRNEKEKNGFEFACVFGVVLFFISIIFFGLMSICPYDYVGYLFLGSLIFVIILFIIFIILIRDNNRMIDKIYDEPDNKDSDVNSNSRLDEYDTIFERNNKVLKEIEKGEYPTSLDNPKKRSDVSNNYKNNSSKWKKCPNCGHKLNSVAKKCPYCSHYFINHTSKSSGDYMGFKIEPKIDPKNKFIKCPHCGRCRNPIAIEIHKKCPLCGKYISPTSLDTLEKCPRGSYNSKKHTSKSSGDYMDFMQFQHEMYMRDLDFQHEMDMMDLDFQHEMDMMDMYDFYD